MSRFGRSYGSVLRRELLSLVLLPQSYVIAAVYVVVSGVFFVSILGAQRQPDLERYFSNIASTLVVLVPVIAMRGFAEERATGGLDVVLSWPLSRAATVLAKFTANLLFVWTLLSTSWIYVRVLSHYGTVEVGKQTAGFIGLMALSAAFTAVALAISARSNSVTGGAFVAVLVLLCGWSAQYATGWPLGKTLAALSPARHIEAAEQGVLYPSDLAYFGVVILLGLGVTLALLDRQSGVPKREHARRVAAVVAVIGFCSIVTAAAGHLPGQIDMTPGQRFTLTSASKDIARAVKAPITVSAFVNPDSVEAVQVRSLTRRYRAAGVDMSLTIVDPDREPGQMKELGVSGYGDMLVRVGDRHELVDHFGEIALTSAIYRVGRDHPRQACFTTGHGERSLTDEGARGYSQFAAALARIGYQTRTVVPAAAGARGELATCDVVVVAGGVGRFEATEVALFEDFLRQGGRLTVLAEGGHTDPQSLNALLGSVGVEFKAGAVEDVAALAGDPASVVCHRYPSDTPITKHLADADLPTLVVGGQEIVTHDDSVTPILQTTPGAWIAGAPDRVARRTVAVAIDRTAVAAGQGNRPSLLRSRVGVVGSADVGANGFLERFGNAEFMGSLVQWTASEAEIISASRDPGGARKLDMTRTDQRQIVRNAVVLPAVAAIIPLPITFRRLKRG